MTGSKHLSRCFHSPRGLLGAFFLHEPCEALLVELLVIAPQVPLCVVGPGQTDAKVGAFPGAFPFFCPICHPFR